MSNELNDKISLLKASGWHPRFGVFAICRMCHERIYYTAFSSPKGAAYHETCAVKSKQAEKIFKSLLLTDSELKKLGLL